MGDILPFPQPRARQAGRPSSVTSAQILADHRFASDPLQRSLSRLACHEPAIGKAASALSLMVQRLFRQPPAQDVSRQGR
jgi:hypothetical protein